MQRSGRYSKIEQVGEGTYGKVYMARDNITGEKVALKKIRMQNEKEGFPITAMRELKILKQLKHQNIIELKEIITSNSNNKEKQSTGIYMVFEYMDHDLTGLMINDTTGWRPTESQIKCYMKQLLQGLSYCHSKGVIHRDIKGSNLLIDNKGILKLADFGLARIFSNEITNYTNRVITLWYRPPELLLGAIQYTTSVDMWSAGCIFAELLGSKPLFPGRNEVDQLDLIFKLCGTPTNDNWADYFTMPWYHLLHNTQKQYQRCLREQFNHLPTAALDLLDQLLTLDPKKRLSANEALRSPYFYTEPYPCDPATHSNFLSQLPPSHEFQAKKRRADKQQNIEYKRYKSDINVTDNSKSSDFNKPYL